MQVEQLIPYPVQLSIPHPIRLLKEAEQQIAAKHCLVCGKKNSILEQHHVAGGDNFNDTVTVCRDCHGKFSNTYQPKWLGRWPGLACYFFGWSDIFELLGQTTGHHYFNELSKRFAQKARYAT
jgi:hypothetical protein